MENSTNQLQSSHPDHLITENKQTLLELNLTLSCRRQRGDLIEVFKLMNHLTRVSPDPFFTIVSSVTRGHDVMDIQAPF